VDCLGLYLGAQTGLVPTQALSPGCEACHLPPCSAVVKNEWNFTSTLPVCVYGMCADNFAFLSLCSFGFFMYSVNYIICGIVDVS
jgi:hypothetical protein